MARSRNIKPGFFKNEDLAECTPFARLCFAGLWTMADREGRLEDRPKRIKGELFPYDSVEVEPLLAELAQWGFIRRYVVGSDRFIFIVKFVEHQAPHGTERDGQVPDEAGFITVHERGKNGYITGNVRLEPYGLTVKTGGSTSVAYQTDNRSLTVKGVVSEGGQNTLIPDSGFLIPDSLIPELTPLPPKGGGRSARIDPDEEPEGFAAWYTLYRRKDSKRDAIKAWRQLGPDDLLQSVMLAALARWKWSDDRTKIPLPASWLRGRRWEDESVAGVVAAQGPQWWVDAGFTHIAEAANARCHIGNYREFRDGVRIAEDSHA